MIVALDGPAGVGKSTVAQKVAAASGMLYLNSGNFYRIITLAHLRSGASPDNNEQLVHTAEQVNITIINDRLYLEGVDVENDLHSDEVDAWVAQHSAVVPIRHRVNALIRQVTKNQDAVVEGRDIGTVVFPGASLKVFLDASIEVRAKRRHAQGTSRKSLKDLEQNIRMRDHIDRNKEEGGLIQASDALYLDTSHLTLEQVCDRVLRKIQDLRHMKPSGS